jgi:hypothetical protein
MSVNDEIEEFGEEPPDSEDLKLVTSKVSEKDVFILAKVILLVCAIIYIIIALLKIYLNDAKGISEVWEYSKVFLNSIISLVLGLYFGQKKEK